MGNPFNIDAFSAELGKHGTANPAYFTVMITQPNTMMQSEPLLLRIESASMPSRTIVTHDQRYYGPMRRIPYAFNSSNFTINVILSEDMREREFFMQWQSLLMGQSSNGVQGPVQPGEFDVGYYDTATKTAKVELKTYATSPAMQGQGKSKKSLVSELVNIAQSIGFDPSIITNPFGLKNTISSVNIDASYTINLVEPFPIQIHEVQMDWNNGGQYAKLTVDIQYRYFTETHANFQTPGNNDAFSLRKGVNMFNRFIPILSLVKSQGVGGALRSSADSVTSGPRNAGSVLKSILPF